MIIPVKTGGGNYDIIIENGALRKVDGIIGHHGKTLVITDSGVPAEYAETVSFQIKNSAVLVIPQGEGSKCFSQYENILRKMLSLGLSRDSAVIAVGGGVVGDLSAFAASTYMRGIDFYNIPTTLLSQVDSSVGGKTGIDVDGIKNIVGTFYQPKGVIIDTNVLKTLPQRQISCGLAEALKMAATFDEKLFSFMEGGVSEKDYDDVIAKLLLIKRAVVEKDERESGLRMALNFGHTLGHGIESVTGLYHGECVALGMLCMCSEEIFPRMESALTSLGLPTRIDAPKEQIINAMSHDKKIKGGEINAVFTDKIGTFEIKAASAEELSRRLDRIIGGEFK